VKRRNDSAIVSVYYESQILVATSSRFTLNFTVDFLGALFRGMISDQMRYDLKIT